MYKDDEFITEQIFEILKAVLQKCYIMNNPKYFFDQILLPSNFINIINLLANKSEEQI